MKRIIIVLFLFFGASSCMMLQQKRVVMKDLYDKFHAELNGDNAPVDTTTKPTLELTTKKTKKEEAREKRIGKKTFYSLKTRRAYTRKGKDSKRYEYEIFFVLKKWQEPNPYVKDIYWYHRKKRTIFTTKIEEVDKKNARILHGPYMKRIGKNIIEEGIYFVGSKHGRWVKYDKNFLLTDKRRFYKGWPTESEITYYDADRKKPKEIIPIQFGRRDGEYFFYSPDGTLLVNGMYKENAKIGIWTEYHANKKKKKETQYGKDPFAKDFVPYTVKEYNDKGKATFDYKKDAVKTDSVSVKQ